MTSFLVIDCGGLHVPTAKMLGDQGHKTFYYNEYHSFYTKFVDFAPGVGVENVIKVKDFGPYLDKVDVIVFPDSGMGRFADYLRKSGKTVFGAGLGELTELNREKSIEIMDKIGVKHPESWHVKGVPSAMEKLGELLGSKVETNQNASGKFYVKFDLFRGSCESFPVASLDDAEFMFDAIRSKVGPYTEVIPIQIQRAAPEGTVECGADLLFNGKEFLMPALVGFESGGSYVGQLTDDLSIYKADLDKWAGYLRSVDYRGAFSFECMYDGTDCSFIDITPRFPYPLGLMFGHFCDDFGALIKGIADGTATTSMLTNGRFIGCMEVFSEEAIERWLPMKFGENTYPCHFMAVGEKTYSVPGLSCVAVAMGEGDSPEEVQEAIQEEAEDLSIYFGQFKKNFVDEIREQYIEPMAKLGFKFGSTASAKADKPVKPAKEEKAESRLPRVAVAKKPEHKGFRLDFKEIMENEKRLASAKGVKLAESGSIADSVASAPASNFDNQLIKDTVAMMGAWK